MPCSTSAAHWASRSAGSFLANRKPTQRNYSGWCKEPRIADIAAAWMLGYTERRFPQAGDEKERDAAIAMVLAMLEKDPKVFRHMR